MTQMAADSVEDGVAYPRMVELLACFMAQVAKRKLPGFCFAGLVPGAEAAFDYCGDCADATCGGQAWVLLTTEYASSQRPPAQDTGATNCAPGWATTLQLGAVRCAPSLDDDGNPPTADEQHAATRLQMADMAAMRAAIACCFGGDDEISVQIGQYTPTLPSGGCVGGTWTVTFW